MLHNDAPLQSKGAGGRSDDKHLSSTAEGALVEKMYNTLTKFKEVVMVVVVVVDSGDIYGGFWGFWGFQ